MPCLTAIIPCKDERLNIRPCVESLRPIADEILIADSGSTDGTLEIVKDVGGCRVVEREYVHSGDFKNWAIPQATHSWVLILDADERLTDTLATEIRQKLQAKPDHDGYWIYRDNFFLGHRLRFGDWGSDKVLRLFRRDLSRYVGDTDHAEVFVNTGQVGVLRNRIEHYSTWTYDHYLAKLSRYSNWQASQWNAGGKKLNPWRFAFGGPYRFFRSYCVRLGFLDGWAGFQVSVLMGIYAFLKQAKLWELQQAIGQPDPESRGLSSGNGGID